MALKTLTTCKPSEFLRQTNKIRKAVANWLTVTDISAIRKRKPVFEVAPKDATVDERAAIVKRNEEAAKRQVRENLMDMLDNILEKHPDETLELLALCCFLEPEEADNYAVGEYLTAFSELISDEAVLGFFTSLMRLDQTGILNSPKQ